MVNGDESNFLMVVFGFLLLLVFFDKSVFLFFVCGGGGMCVMCECYVEEGGGDVFLMELNYLIRREVVEYKCLVC